MKKYLKMVFGGVGVSVVVSGVVYASFWGSPRSFEELYQEAIKATDSIATIYREQLIREFRARRDLALHKGQKAFVGNKQEEVDRLQALILSIDETITGIEQVFPPTVERERIGSSAASHDFIQGA